MMDIRVASAVAVLLASLCAVTSAMSLPGSQLKDNSLDADSSMPRDTSRRASWLETRDLEDDFKDLVYLTLQKLAEEGRVDPRVLPTQDEELDEEHVQEKRGRWQGFCFRRTKSGRFLPYICWKGDRK